MFPFQAIVVNYIANIESKCSSTTRLNIAMPLAPHTLIQLIANIKTINALLLIYHLYYKGRFKGIWDTDSDDGVYIVVLADSHIKRM